MAKNNEEKKVFSCEFCKYSTFFSKDYKKHLITEKHFLNVKTINDKIEDTNIQNEPEISCDEMDEKNDFRCEFCERVYKTRSGLYKHYMNSCSISKTPKLLSCIKQMEQNRLMSKKCNMKNNKMKYEYLLKKYHDETIELIKLWDEEIKKNTDI